MARLAVVDPVSAGRFIVARATARGHACTLVFSHERVMAACDSATRALARATLLHADHAGTAASLADAGTEAVLAGAESGVALAEELAARLGLPGNDPATTGWRRDKWLMAQAACRGGLRICAQELCTGVEPALRWAAAHGYPVVVKPLQSSGTEMVRVCDDPATLAAYAGEILSRPDKYGHAGDSLLIQAFVMGPEYTVDGVSVQGDFTAFAVGRYRKLRLNHAQVYDRLDLLDAATDSQARQLVEYVGRLAPALGIAFGPSHSEIILSADGPVMVETAARAHGGIAASVIDGAFSPSFLDAIVDSVLGIPAMQAGRRQRAASICFLISRQRGIVADLPGAALVEALPTFQRLVWTVAVGERVVETYDLPTCPALIAFSDPDPQAIERDIAAVREWELQGRLIALQPAAVPA